ncbi:unnamed protein product [Blepharisma stoltei]|uniref:PPM-type phosphatase domain-containing protein n=1 Tax=Blepharisma stoltei TaxID=1481888 RepID=A0AAU9I7Y5_9CILI|nr:unnamed protein product [Blepharisma stoltei]
MGNCNNSAKPESPQTGVSYSEIAMLKIKERDFAGHVVNLDKIKFKLTSPCLSLNARYLHMPYAFDITGTVLPGLDPRELVDKECQDNIIFLEKENTLLAALFDGHGQDGFKVTEFCKKFMNRYFREKFEDFKIKPKEAISRIIEDCDAAIKANPGEINYLISGTTAVVLFIDGNNIYAASVGDSRAILGTIPKSADEVPKTAHSAPNPYKTVVEPKRLLNSIALTVDQKPNHQEELERIEKSGGKVQQLTDERGNKIGPFRVWKGNGNIPGLAMSRSIGDGVAKECGVISTPIVHDFQLFPDRDQFIIMGSDGVWDVFDNQEAVNYVEKYRSECLKTAQSNCSYPIKPENSTISQLLGEEARCRWFGICEDEDVIIDDISVIIIEISTLIPLSHIDTSEAEDRRTVRLNSLGEIKEETKPMVSNMLRGDAVRGSFIPAKDPNAKRVRIDPKRGSHAIVEGNEEPEGQIDVPFVDDEHKLD